MRILLICLMLLPAASFAGNRAANPLGLVVSIGNPFPTAIGGNLGYHLDDWGRLSGGYGTVSASLGANKLEATTYGAQLNFFVSNWNLSPTAGLGWSNVDVTLTGSAVSGLDAGGFTASDSHFFATFGIDWVASSGFHLAGGYNHSLKSGVGGLLYINLGWYF